jgi:signal transduction histidine kinase/ligand-binding sensor domain-containing protein
MIPQKLHLFSVQLQRLSFFLLLLILNGNFCNAQESGSYSFEHISELDGLTNNNVLFVTQDSKGFIWVGTEGGLNRYDGYRFKQYKHDSTDSLSISDNYVTSLCEISEDKYLVGTMNGLNIFNPQLGVFKSYNLEQTGLANYNWVTSIVPSKFGGVWIGTRSGLYRYLDNYDSVSWLNEENRKDFIYQTKDIQLLHYKHANTSSEQLNDDAVFTLLEDTKANLWIGTDFGGISTGALHKLSPGKNNDYPQISKIYKYNKNKPDKSIGKFPSSLFEDSSGNIWLGTWLFGLYRINPVTDEIVRFHEKAKIAGRQICNNIFMMKEDFQKNIWIASYNKGLYKLDAAQVSSDTPSFTNFTVDHSEMNWLTSNYLRNLFVDRSGVVWISSLGNGLNKIKEERIFDFLKPVKNSKESIPHEDVTGIYLDDQNSLWLGFPDGYFSWIDNKKIESYQLKNNKSKIRCFIEKNEDEVLIGAFGGGLHLFNKKDKTITDAIKLYGAADSLQKKSFECFRRINDSIILCGLSSRTGLIEFNTNANSFKKIGNFQFINDITLEDENKIWLYTSWSDIKILDLNYNTINAVYKKKLFNVFNAGVKDSKGNTWVASKFGLRIIDSTLLMKPFEYDENLRDGEIRGIINGENDDMFVFGKSGIIRVSPKQKSVVRLDGTRGLLFRKAVKSSDGTIFIASNGGLVSFHPDSVQTNKIVPEVAITRFEIFNKEIEVNDSLHGEIVLSKDISYTESIELTHNSNVLYFEFSCLDYSATDKNQYAYKLEGVDQDWVYPDRNRNFASYAGLQYGKYIFKLKASNDSGLWNEKGVNLEVVILPPWWSTIWFRILIILTGGILIWAYVHRKQRILRKANLILERKVTEKTKELLSKNSQLHEIVKAKDLFLSILAHDLRNPFGTIDQLLGILYDNYETYSDKERKELLGDLKQLAGNTYIILENLLIWGRRNNNKLNKPKLTELDLKTQILMVMNQFTCHPKNIKIEWNDRISHQVMADFNLLDFIMRNLIQNAFKFSHENSKVEIKTQVDNDKIWIVIKDFGMGMDRNQVNDLLQSSKIESTSGTMGEKGTGLGIVNCRAFIRMMSGEFRIESKLGEGSSFIFSLPLVVKE